MFYIAHSKNTVEELIATPNEYGIEMDIRSSGQKLICQHDPFGAGVSFDEWIKHYHHKILVLNIKEEGIEYRVKDIVEKQGIKDYFFLDLSFPFLVKMLNTGEKRVAVRFSEFEALETVLALAGRAEWVWIDCFTRLPLDDDKFSKLKQAGFKLCLVSPELQNRKKDLTDYKSYIIKKGWDFDAVCTKFPELWK